MLLFTESWDGEGTTGANYQGKDSGRAVWTTHTGGTVGATQGRHGNGRAPNNDVLTIDSAHQDDLILAAFAFRTTTISAQNIIGFLGNSAAREHVRLSLTATGSIKLVRAPFDENVLLEDSATNVIQVDTWHYIEMKILVADSGTWEVRVDGVAVLSGSGDTRNVAGAANVDTIQFYGTGGATYLDDFILLNGVDSGVVGRPNNTFIGDVFVEALFPTGNGNSSQFDGSDGNSTDNYLLVDELGSDGDTTYVESGVDDEKDTYQFGNTSGTGGVAGVVAYARARRTDADSRDIAIVSRLSTATPTEQDSADQPLASSYAGHGEVFEADPGGDPWTRPNVDAGEWGAKSRPT